MKKILICSFIIILVGFGCEKETVKNSDLLKTTWILSFIKDTKTNAVTYYPSDAPGKISIIFTDSSNVLLFNGICNGGMGTYSYFPLTGTVNISEIGTTKIYCKYVEWEGYTTHNLDSAFSFKINGTNLAVYSNGEYNLYFYRE